MTIRRVKAVTYDFWDTLMWEVPGTVRSLRHAAIDDLMNEFGIELQAGDIERELKAISEMQRDAWMSGGIFQPDEGAAHFGIKIGGGELSASQQKRVEEAIFLSASEPELNVSDGAVETLGAPHDRGIKLAIVCDVGLTPSTVLRRCLDRVGLLELLDGWAFSDEVGCYKPSREIFEHALGSIGVGPEDAAHVGDLKRTDVAGSRAFGMTSVRYRGVTDDPSEGFEEADHVISQHEEILSIF